MTKRRTIGAVGALLSAALLAAPAAAMHVELAVKPGVDFSAYETWDWKEPPVELAQGTDDELDERIRLSAEEVLAGRGLERSNEAPDLWITYTGFVEDELEIEGVRREITRHVAWIGDPNSHSVRSHQMGTLLFEILDAGDERIVWSGWATEVARTPGKLRKKAVTAVKRILSHFPPK